MRIHCEANIPEEVRKIMTTLTLNYEDKFWWASQLLRIGADLHFCTYNECKPNGEVVTCLVFEREALKVTLEAEYKGIKMTLEYSGILEESTEFNQRLWKCFTQSLPHVGRSAVLALIELGNISKGLYRDFDY